MPDTVGKGAAAESNLREPDPEAGAAVAAMMQRVASQGFVRNRLTVLQGGAKRPSARGEAGARSASGGEPRAEADMPLFAGALAFAETTTLMLTTPDSHPDSRVQQIREARMKGYEGDSCGECGNFTLLRNGTCLKCDTCGSTSGCS
jgi:ribonucleoside-diphosphate reductase alpha chain